MPRKNYNWPKVKATKTAEEWRKINKAYALRFRLRNQLRVQGAELLNKIHNYHLVENPGPSDALIDEVRKVLRLPYAWNQEDYDHATARLRDIAGKLEKIKYQMTHKSSALANILMLIFINSKDSEDVKAAALMGTMEFMANQLSLEKIESLENSRTNFVMTLLRTKDSYYPKWFPKFLYNNILQLLSEKDLEKFTKWLMKMVIANKNRQGIMQAMTVDKKDEEVVIG